LSGAAVERFLGPLVEAFPGAFGGHVGKDGDKGFAVLAVHCDKMDTLAFSASLS